MASVATSSPSDDRPAGFTRHAPAEKSGPSDQRFNEQFQAISRQLDGIKVTWRSSGGELKLCLWHAKSRNEARFAVKRSDPWVEIKRRILDAASDLILTAADGRRRPAR